MLVGFVWLLDKLVSGDFRTHCILAVGEALMPPVDQSVFAETPRKTVHFTAGRQQCLPYSTYALRCNIRCRNTNLPYCQGKPISILILYLLSFLFYLLLSPPGWAGILHGFYMNFA